MKVSSVLIGICSFSGVAWMFSPGGQSESFSDLAFIINGLLGLMFSVAVIWALVDFWSSDRSKDSKLYWTVLSAFFSPIAVPVYWCRRTFKGDKRSG